MPHRFESVAPPAILAAAMLLTTSAASYAAEYTWTGITNNNWSLDAADLNWSGLPWTNGNAANFNLFTGTTIQVLSPITTSKIYFRDSWILANAGGSLAFPGTGLMSLTSSGASSINVPIIDSSGSTSVKAYGDPGGAPSSGTGTITLSAANTYSGTTTISATTVSIPADSALGTNAGSNALTFLGGTLLATESFTLAATRGVALGAISPNYLAGGTLNVAEGKTLTYNGTISELTTQHSTLYKKGSGTLVLGGTSNSYEAISLNGGILAIAGPGSLGNATRINFMSGGLSAMNSMTLSHEGLIGTTASSTFSATIDVADNAVLTYTGNIHNYLSYNTGGLVKTGNGTLVLPNFNSYVGGTTILGGTVIADAFGGSLGAGNVALEAGTLGGHGRVSGRVIAGSSPHTIAPSVNRSPTDTGTLTVGRLTTNEHTTLSFNLVAPGTSDLIKVSLTHGLVFVGGTIEVANTSAGIGSLGYYRIFQYSGSIGGDGVSSLILPTGSDGIVYTLDLIRDSGYIDLHRGIGGDANDDGAVDLTDLATLGNQWQQSGSWTDGDFNGDGMVDLTDLAILGGQWQSSLAGGQSEISSVHLPDLPTPVPEPTSLAILSLASVALGARHRRR